MPNKTYLILCFGLCLALGANSAPQRSKINTEEEEEKVAEIKKFHVNSKIQLRYAITDVETQMQNRHSEAKEVFFDMYIPKEAFVSNFTMDIKGKTYQAAVKTKEVAKKIYENSTDTSGLLQSISQPEFTDGKQVTFSAKLDPAEKVTFNLRYEELLQRSEQGKYHYEVNIQPKNQKIPDFKIKVTINESLPLDGISVKRVKNKDEAKFQAEDISKGSLTYDQKLAPKIAYIDLRPNEAKNNGKDWKFVVNYDVKRPDDGNDVQIGAGKFVHYFAPDNLPTMPKHVIFVIDVSGSMGGRKLEQTKDAMTTMLDKMSEKNIDNFNIILFSSDITVWNNGDNFDLSYSIFKNNGDVGPAYDYVLGLEIEGSTNINDALLRAISVAKNVKASEEIDSKTQQMIVFLTDGQPTEGETDGPTIKENVRQANSESKIPIYGLALGDGADFDLIKDISDESNGFAQRIYESGNSFEQLEDFYNKISDPKLKDVTFEYLVNGERIVPENLTTTAIDQVFGSNEYSIAGTFPEEKQVNEIEVIMKAKNQIGSIEKFFYLRPCYIPHPVTLPESSVNILPRPSKLPRIINPDRCFPTIIPQPIWKQSSTEIFMERLWAYKRINYLLSDSTECTKAISNYDEGLDSITAPSEEKIDEVNSEKEENTDCENEATKLALKYNFVTDLTSLVIEEDDDYINKGPIEIGKKPRPSYPGHLNSYMASYASYGAPVLKSGSYKPASYLSYAAPAPPRSAFGPKLALSGSSGKGNGMANGTRNRNRFQKPQRRPSSTYPPKFPQPPPTTTTTQVPSTTTLGFCKMTMFEQTYFRGNSVEITGDVSDFNDVSFDNEIASLKIEGDCCWTLFTDSNYQGVSMNLNVGEYQSATNIRDIFKKASSAKTSC